MSEGYMCVIIFTLLVIGEILIAIKICIISHCPHFCDYQAHARTIE